uniref:AMP-activated protein kinase glycogen-binding domain-containing protein n=1 Tax=Arcella intermedia TaxID=1963864 RepID=A0A6B2LGQ5_9EUKA
MAMKKESGSWKGSIFLLPGTYTYKYVVDERWCFDVEKPTVTAGSTTNNQIEVVDYLQQLLLERSKTRDDIHQEISAAFNQDKTLLQAKHTQDLNLHAQELAALRAQLSDLHRDHANQKNQWEYRLNTLQHEVERNKKAINEKRSVIETEVRSKYDVLVTAQHNEILLLKAQMEELRAKQVEGFPTTGGEEKGEESSHVNNIAK